MDRLSHMCFQKTPIESRDIQPWLVTLKPNTNKQITKKFS